MIHIPVEVDIAGIYMPPLLPAATLGVLAMMVTVTLLNRTRLSRYFEQPALVMLALAALYTVLIGTFVIPT